MGIYTLNESIVVKTTLAKAWAFIQNPNNLNRITPDNMAFEIVSEVPEKMYNGLSIAYRVKIPVLGTTNWLSEIKHIREPYAFVDDQRIGPYKLWYHYHELKEVKGGIEVIDKVYYEVPYGIFGKLAHWLFIRRMLKQIFGYRNKMFRKLLES